MNMKTLPPLHYRYPTKTTARRRATAPAVLIGRTQETVLPASPPPKMLRTPQLTRKEISRIKTTLADNVSLDATHTNQPINLATHLNTTRDNGRPVVVISPPKAARTPTTIYYYDPEAQLGKSTCAVYHGQHYREDSDGQRLHYPKAMKRFMSLDDLRQRDFNGVDVEREARMNNHIDGMGAATLLHYDEDIQGVPIHNALLVTEISHGDAGMNLLDYLTNLQEPALTSSDFDEIPRQLAYAVRKAHRKNSSHGDIKIDNFMINTNTHKVKLIDFGHSHLVNEPSDSPLHGTGIYVDPVIVLIHEVARNKILKATLQAMQANLAGEETILEEWKAELAITVRVHRQMLLRHDLDQSTREKYKDFLDSYESTLAYYEKSINDRRTNLLPVVHQYETQASHLATFPNHKLLAKEFSNADEFSLASDIYSLGSCFYSFLTIGNQYSHIELREALTETNPPSGYIPKKIADFARRPTNHAPSDRLHDELLYTLIQKMQHPDPRSRPTIDVVCQQLASIEKKSRAMQALHTLQQLLAATPATTDKLSDNHVITMITSYRNSAHLTKLQKLDLDRLQQSYINLSNEISAYLTMTNSKTFSLNRVYQFYQRSAELIHQPQFKSLHTNRDWVSRILNAITYPFAWLGGALQGNLELKTYGFDLFACHTKTANVGVSNFIVDNYIATMSQAALPAPMAIS